MPPSVGNIFRPKTVVKITRTYLFTNLQFYLYLCCCLIWGAVYTLMIYGKQCVSFD